MTPEWSITITECSIELECSAEKVLQLLKSGIIPAVKPGKAWVIPRKTFFEAIERWAVNVAKERLAST